ncbi:MAG: O-antigen ligase family protein [Lachnospiraceae bacterium]|nr:O-antigen ligase family protein [Lachnospiraceae bacterium]
MNLEGQFDRNEKRRRIGNISLLAAVFILTTAYFHFYSWYSLLAPYGTLTAAVFLIVTFFCYVDVSYALKDPAFYLMAFADVLALINLFAIGSHKGAILTVADFLLILYLANKVVFTKKEMIVSALYTGFFFIYWTIDVKGYFKGYNTNYGGLVLISGFIFLIYAVEYFFHGGQQGNGADNAGGKGPTVNISAYGNPAAGEPVKGGYVNDEPEKTTEPVPQVPAKHDRMNSFIKLCMGTCKYQRLLRLSEVILFYVAFRIIAWYRSRCALVGLVVFLVLLLIPKGIWKNKVIYGILVFSGTAGSILFSAFYVWLGVMKEELTLRLFYKDIISGREEIWAELWEEYLKKPFTGIGSSYVMKLEWMEGLFEVHSGLLDILIVHGLVVFIIVCMFLVFRLFGIREIIAQSYAARSAMAGIFAMLFTAFMENYIIVAPFSLMFLCLFAYINHIGTEAKIPGSMKNTTGS